MCYIDLEPCDVWEENKVKAARKRHRCDACGGAVAVGESYYRHFSVYDDSATSEKICMPCYEAREVFADAHDGQSTNPSYFVELLNSCIGEDEESDTKWLPMLHAMMFRRAERLLSEPL